METTWTSRSRGKARVLYTLNNTNFPYLDALQVIISLTDRKIFSPPTSDKFQMECIQLKIMPFQVGASTLYSGQSVRNFFAVPAHTIIIQTLILQILITTRWTKNSGKRQINKDMSILRTEATS